MRSNVNLVVLQGSPTYQVVHRILLLRPSSEDGMFFRIGSSSPNCPSVAALPSQVDLYPTSPALASLIGGACPSATSAHVFGRPGAGGEPSAGNGAGDMFGRAADFTRMTTRSAQGVGGNSASAGSRGMLEFTLLPYFMIASRLYGSRQLVTPGASMTWPSNTQVKSCSLRIRNPSGINSPGCLTVTCVSLTVTSHFSNGELSRQGFFRFARL
jgi:hypothetical protein